MGVSGRLWEKYYECFGRKMVSNNIKTLSIHLNQTKLGTLATKNSKIYFEYDHDFLKTGIEISPYKLPLKPGVFRFDDDTFSGIWGIFADSMPDGWGRLLMDRHFLKQGINPNSVNPLERLAFVGKNGMGALSYHPQIDIENKITDINLDKLFASSQAILEGSSEELLDELLVLGGSSGGATPKVLVQISDDKKEVLHSKEQLKNGFNHWIVKFASSHDHQDIGAVEYAYSLMAKAAGIAIPETTLIHTKKGSYFAAKRFDREKDQKIHMHSLAGISHSDFRYPTLDYDDLLTLTMHLTRDMQEVKKAFRLACFNLLTHNRDDHAKNFSYLMDEKGTWQFSPAYDLTFSYGPGEGKNPTINHLIKLGKKHSIKDTQKIIKEVKDAVLQWQYFAKEAGVNRTFTSEIRKNFLI